MINPQAAASDSRLDTWKQFPWMPGLDTTNDVTLLSPEDAVASDHIVLGQKGNAQQRPGISYNWDNGTSVARTFLIGGTQFYWGSTAPRTDSRVAVDSKGNIYAYTAGGARTLLAAAGAFWTNPTRACFAVLNNILVMAADGSTNYPLQWDGTTLQLLQGTPPNFSIVREWTGRLWTDDKDDPDLLNYSPPYDPNTWNGVGDSGGLYVGTGDGDALGISAIFPPFQGTLFVAKQGRMYNVSGDNPYDYDITTVSNGIGCQSHNAVVAVDQDDVLFISRRGIHSLVATINYGNFAATYVSQKIQKSFVNNWPKNRLFAAQGAYIPEINSVAFAVTDTTTGSGTNRSLWFYNIQFKKWYTWQNVQCSCLFAAIDTDQTRLYLGQEDSRLAQTFNSQIFDILEDASHAAIPVNIMTGVVYVDNAQETIKAFKLLGLAITITGNSNISVNVFIDNFQVQTFNYSDLVAGALLGVNFVLGQSRLGGQEKLAPSWQPMDGFGSGIQLQVQKSDTTSDLSVQGIFLQWEQAGTSQEVRY